MSDSLECHPPHGMELPALALQVLLAETGVREFVICAGARNSALLVMLAAVPGLRLWHHFEERSAAFFALGRVLDHEHPVAVVTTSGTAVAELLPAVIEAHYQGLPLIVLTADRPVSYRGTGAPQAIEQSGIFGSYPSLSLDLTDPLDAPSGLAGLSGWNQRGPLHLNLCMEEPTAAVLPLLRRSAALMEVRPAASGAHPPPLRHEPDWSAWPEPVILVGDLLASEQAAVTRLVLHLQAPVYAEGASGLRESPALQPWLISGGDKALGHTPHRAVIRLGGVPACRFWRDLESRPDIPVLSLTRSGHPGLARPSRVLPLSTILTIPPPGPSAPPAPAKLPQPAISHDGRGWGAALDRCLAAHPASEPAMIRGLSLGIPEDAAVLTGNSLPIREWNLGAGRDLPHHARALRGANGIEGNLSAFLGLAADASEGWCLVGDLTTLYDLAAPWMLAQLGISRLRFVIIQNAGGRIFSRLPALQGLTAFERQLMENPHEVSLAGWARQWGMAHLKAQGHVPLLNALPDRVVIELYPDPVATESFWQSWATASRLPGA